MKKIYAMLLIIMLILSFNVASANTINSIKMDIYVDEIGNAQVTEIWDCYATKNTEWYHTYDNLGKSKITNFTVKDENNIVYENVNNWNVNGSFNNKKYKCGINGISNGVELCFGISEYNKNKTYITTYTITNFVANLTDSQMMYWTLIDFSQEIGEVYIKIHSDFDYADTVGVWGFGNYGGTAYVYDGYIEMQSPGNLKSNEYMTILVKFPNSTFNITDNTYNNDFNYYLNMAKKDSTAYEKSENEFLNLCIICFFLIPFIIAVMVILTNKSGGFVSYKFIPRDERKAVKEYKEYFRDIPCNKDLFRAYLLAYQYEILNKKADFLGAILLDLLRKGKIRIEKREVGFAKKKVEDCIILMVDKAEIENKMEAKLYDMLVKASKNNVLEKKEFEKWTSKNYSNFLGWFDEVLSDEKVKLANENIIQLSTGKTDFKILNNDYLKSEALSLKGLKNYLKDYTLIHDREAIEVNLFEEYLIFAQILGIAKTVEKEFKNLYPELIEQSAFKTFDNFDFIYYTSNSSISKANTARSEAVSRANSYSSGGGGFSSGGGGGGSFGGGRRRLTLVENMGIL